MKDMFTSRVQAVAQLLAKGRLAHVANGRFARSLLQNPQLARRRWLRLFGWPGMVGIGLLVMCGAMYFSAIQPARINLEEARRNAISMQEKVKLAANGLSHNQLSPAEQLAEFYRAFPDEKNLQPWLEKIFIVAQNSGVRLDKGEYKVTRDRVGRLMRFQVTLPIRSEYPQIRKFLSGLRSEIPIIALEHLEFERQKIGESLVEAKIILALYLVQET
jgi:Tfp pilus assembly protein PilO